MKKFLVITAIATSVLGLGTFAALVSFAGSTIAIQERHPHLDYDVVRDAHWNLIKAGLRGELKDVDTDDDVVMDALFLKEVARLATV